MNGGYRKKHLVMGVFRVSFICISQFEQLYAQLIITERFGRYDKACMKNGGTGSIGFTGHSI